MSASKSSPESLTDFWMKNLGVTEKTQSTSLKNSKTLSAFNLCIGEYIRVSPTDDLPEEGSLVNHPQRYREYVAQKNSFKPGWGKIKKTYVDELKSAKDMNRPAFIQMCKDIQNGEINAIICTELSRLSRSVKDFVQFWEFLKRHNIKLILVNSFIDTSDFMGEYWLYQEINNAEMERKRIIHRIRSGHMSRANRGLASGGVRILGYDPDPHKACHILVNKKEIKYVNLIFDKFLELGSIRAVAKYLNKKGFRTKKYITMKKGLERGGKKWTSMTIHSLLTNLTYLGLREINKSQRSKDQNLLSENEKYKITKAQWPAIVDEKKFLSVQKLLQKNKKVSRPGTHVYLLTGLLECGICGASLIGKSANGRSETYFYYTHQRTFKIEGNRHKERCHLESIPAIAIEDTVLSKIQELSVDESLLRKIAKSSQLALVKEEKNTKKLLDSRRNEARQTKQEIDALLSVAAENNSTKDTVLKRVEELSKNQKKIEDHIQTLSAKRRELKNRKVDIREARQFFHEFSRNIRKLSAHLQKEAVRSLVKRVLLTEDQVTVELFSGYQYFLNSPNNLEYLKKLQDTENGDCLNMNELALTSGSHDVRATLPLLFPMVISPCIYFL